MSSLIKNLLIHHTHISFGESATPNYSFIHLIDIYWTVCHALCKPSALMDLQSRARDKYLHVQCHWVLNLVMSPLEEGCGVLGLRVEHVVEVRA